MKTSPWARACKLSHKIDPYHICQDLIYNEKISRLLDQKLNESLVLVDKLWCQGENN